MALWEVSQKESIPNKVNFILTEDHYIPGVNPDETKEKSKKLGASPVTFPETIAGHILGPVPFLCLKWPIVFLPRKT